VLNRPVLDTESAFLLAPMRAGVRLTTGAEFAGLDEPPTPVQLAAVYPHKKLQDPKVRLLLDFMAERCQRLIKDLLAGR